MFGVTNKTHARDNSCPDLTQFAQINKFQPSSDQEHRAESTAEHVGRELIITTHVLMKNA